MSKGASSTVFLMLPALALLATAVQAQNSAGPDALVVLPGSQSDGPQRAASPGFGTASNSAVSYVAHAFAPIDSSVTWEFGTEAENLSIFRTGGSSLFEAPVNLPTGSLIQSVEFRFCDINVNARFETFLTINDKTGNGEVFQGQLVSSTDAEAPGCINRTFTPVTPIEIDNDNKAYSLEAYLGAANNSIVLAHGRIYYSLQVSPAPLTATFTDVPTDHGFFRFVEALASAGITGGCGGGNYCPDNPVTRGQMAAFLSIALGLHFPN